MKFLRFVSAVTLSSILFGINTAIPASAQLNLELPDMNLPDFNRPGSTATGNIDAPAIGRQLYRNLRRSRPLIEDPELTTWLRQLVNRLAAHAPGVNQSIHVALENNPAINAYALTGGIIVVNSGLILNTQSESELAAVLAHEIAHVSQRHLARMANDRKSNPLMTGLGILAGAAVASKSPEAAQAIITGTIAMQAHQQIAYSQQYELEADRVGLRILSRARLNPLGMPAFLEKLERSESNPYGNLGQYLSSHPLTINRLSDTRNRAKKMSKGNIRESINYHFAQEKLRTLARHPTSTTQNSTSTTLVAYRQGLRQLQAGRHAAVVQLLSHHTAQLPTALLSARSLNALQRFDETKRLLQPLLHHHPQHEALHLLLAQAMVGRGQPQQGWQLLQRLHLSEQTSLEFFEAAQHIAQRAGRRQEAVLYHAERNLRLGEYRYARLSLEQAINSAGDTPTSRRLRNKLAEVSRAKSELDYLKN